MLFADSRGACVYWGTERTALYNEPFSVNAGGAHPELMGQPFYVGFPELWDGIKGLFQQAEDTGVTVDVDNIPLFTERNGYLEETYFIGQFIPLRGDSGRVEGFYNTVYESTFRVLNDRYRNIVNTVVALPPLPVERMLAKTIETLASGERDVPMALLYSADELFSPGHTYLRLHGSVAVPQDHICAPSKVDLETSDEGFVPLFRKVRATGSLLVLSVTDGSLRRDAGHLLDNIEWRGFGEPCRDIIIAPLESGGRLLGFMVLGTNPRRGFCDEVRHFTRDLIRQIEARWGSAVSADGARQREEKLVRDLTESQRRLRHMATSAPVGMVHIDKNGSITWANDQFYDITGHPRDKPTMDEFNKVFVEEDRNKSRDNLENLFHGQPRTDIELRLRRKFRPPGQEGEALEINAWVLAMGFPLVEDGDVKVVMGCVTDISHQKWAEKVQIDNAAAATEAKRLQEQFIDTTSHEMRNPLTAMIQLADGIATSLDDFHHESATPDDYLLLLNGNVDSARTILSCAAHQKRIIDDVLILSRLESQMLSITPALVSAPAILKDVAKMFAGEITCHDMKLEVQRQPSYDLCRVDTVQLDPSRLTQIFINLISNAIKFTSTEPKREISIMYGAALEESDIHKVLSFMQWRPRRDSKPDVASGPDWGDGDLIYLYFLVKDTGPGLKPKEMDRLFQRFGQASERTHIRYGGTGLGLYLCRQLAEKQGGQVSVTSTAGQGATFGFYIQARRAENAAGSCDSSLHHVSASGTPRTAFPRPQTPPVSVAQKRNQTQQGLHVLLVEDNLVNQKILQRQLTKAHCTVHVANHGLEALHFLEKAECWADNDSGPRIDCILLDWEMPVMNGLECCRQIRAYECEGRITRHLTTIAITANARSEQIQHAFDAGMDAVLPKPFTIKQVMAKILETTNHR